MFRVFEASNAVRWIELKITNPCKRATQFLPLPEGVGEGALKSSLRSGFGIIIIIIVIIRQLLRQRIAASE